MCSQETCKVERNNIDWDQIILFEELQLKRRIAHCCVLCIILYIHVVVCSAVGMLCSCGEREMTGRDHCGTLCGLYHQLWLWTLPNAQAFHLNWCFVVVFVVLAPAVVVIFAAAEDQVVHSVWPYTTSMDLFTWSFLCLDSNACNQSIPGKKYQWLFEMYNVLKIRPSKQCKSFIDVLILRNIWRSIFCGGDEKWINCRAVLVGNWWYWVIMGRYWL